MINDFYKKKLGYKPKIAVLGLNPHCESVARYNEDEKIIKPSINKLIKQEFKVSGPYSADTIFLKNNRKKLETVLLKSLKEDPVESTLVGWTQMGHFEIQRKRERIQI